MEAQKQQLWISVSVLPPALAPFRSRNSNWVQIILWKAKALGPAAWPGPQAGGWVLISLSALQGD